MRTTPFVLFCALLLIAAPVAAAPEEDGPKAEKTDRSDSRDRKSVV